MSIDITPAPHEDPALELLRPYLTEAVLALHNAGVTVVRSWLDPSGPRDATIVLADGRALVWDEETGWRVGPYVAGEQGVRTVLADAVHLGGGVLPVPSEVVWRLLAGITGSCVKYRAHDENPAAFDAVVRALAPARVLA
ncbi:DUF6292 family protein [Actinomadura macrotermitis]|uniref:DUF6292 domain-containing protein n=1 Tax=Actinomadura macrotermitis TaxID=2585200 RepID=A0A7K0C162_9ACTN|nr:DUF6292 family protein [Actinomadura macrotermitis]MQY07205.1 hypothetical protein [Actinomadura macrotermitis]